MKALAFGGIVALIFLPTCLSIPEEGSGDTGTEGSSNDGGVMPLDEDNDGYLREALNGRPSDCDDKDSAKHPGALDVCGNGVDEDCFDGDLPCEDSIGPVVLTSTIGQQTIASRALEAVLSENKNWTITRLSQPGGPNLLFTNEALNERFVSTQIWERAFSWAPDITEPTMVIESDGGAVFRARVNWSAGLDQSNQPRALDGRTIYTFYPDGRVHLDMDVTVEENSDTRFLSFAVALDPARFSQANWSGGQAEAINPPQNDFHEIHRSTEMRGWSCLHGATGAPMIGFAYNVPAGSGAGPRIMESEINGSQSRQVALIFDWVYNEMPPLGAAQGDFTLLVGTSSGGLPCDAVHSAVLAHHGPRPLIPTSPVTFRTDGIGDDDQDGYNEGGGFWDLNAHASRELNVSVQILRGVIGPTLAIRIGGVPTKFNPVLFVDNARWEHGRNYLYKKQGGTQDSTGWLFINERLKPLSRMRLLFPLER